MFRLAHSLFLLLFFRYAQSDVLAYMESQLCQRPVEPHPWLSAIVLTALLVGIGWVAQKVMALRLRHTQGAYVLVAWLAAALVSLPFATWHHQAVLLAVALLLFGCTLLGQGRGKLRSEEVKEFKVQSSKFKARSEEVKEGRRKKEEGERATPRSNSSLFTLHSSLRSSASLLLLCLFTGLGAAATDVRHYELRTAQALRTGHPKQAYRVGERSLATSPRLFALRCYLMAKTRKRGLGHHLFKQPVPAGGSANLLFPTDEAQRLLLSPDSLYRLLGGIPQPGESHIDYLRRCAAQAAQANPATLRPLAPIDYYLCALLLDRRLDDFARDVVRLYPRMVQSGNLPAFYAHALVYHSHRTAPSAPAYHDDAIEANYQDYLHMADTIPLLRPRTNLLRRSYGETYWWWYEYGLPELDATN